MKKTLKFGFLAGVGATIIAACSPVKLLNAVTPSGAFDLRKDVAYGDFKRQTLDVYTAVEPKIDAPIIIFVHGGSWTTGNKDIYKFVGQSFADAGYTVIVPNYRLYPEARFPGFIEDAAKAAAWTHKTYPDRKIVLMGHSAGAHTTLNLAMNDRYLSDEGLNRCALVAGAVGLAGPYGERPFTEEPYITIFPQRNTGDDAPLSFADQGVPPLLLLTGADDTTVNPYNSPLLAERVAENGGQATSKSYEGLNHTGIIRVLSKFFDGDAPVKQDILSFIESLPVDANNYCDR